MRRYSLLSTLVWTAICLGTASLAAAQQQPLPPVLPQKLAPVETVERPTTGAVIQGKLPDDLPQAKLLFVTYQPITLPPDGPKGWGQARASYFQQKNHNKVIGESNLQLRQAADRYPYAYRITTPDSVAYYRDQQGYKYLLMHTAFNAVAEGTYTGTIGNGAGLGRTYNYAKAALYIQDLTSRDRFVFDELNETDIYYYEGQVERLRKKITKQFNPKK